MTDILFTIDDPMMAVEVETFDISVAVGVESAGTVVVSSGDDTPTSLQLQPGAVTLTLTGATPTVRIAVPLDPDAVAVDDHFFDDLDELDRPWIPVTDSRIGVATGCAYPVTPDGTLALVVQESPLVKTGGTDFVIELHMSTHVGDGSSQEACFYFGDADGNGALFSLRESLGELEVSKLIAFQVDSQLAFATTTPWSDDSFFDLERVGKTYRVYSYYGGQTLSWTDADAPDTLIPLDDDHRIIGFGLRNTGGNYARVDEFWTFLE